MISGQGIAGGTGHGDVRLITHPSGSVNNSQLIIILADDGTEIEAELSQTDNAGWLTNCHGTTFAFGVVWIDNQPQRWRPINLLNWARDNIRSLRRIDRNNVRVGSGMGF